jgi:signal peptidase I
MTHTWQTALKQTGWLFLSGLLLCGLAFATHSILLRIHGLQLLTIESNSMAPTFVRGDALIVDTKSTPIRAGEVVSYRSPHDASVTISHRVRAVDGSGYQTQGDALDQPDQSVGSDQIIGKDIAVLPQFGKVITLFRSKVGLTLFVYLPALGLLAYEVARLMAVAATRSYRIHRWRAVDSREYN